MRGLGGLQLLTPTPPSHHERTGYHSITCNPPAFYEIVKRSRGHKRKLREICLISKGIFPRSTGKCAEKKKTEKRTCILIYTHEGLSNQENSAVHIPAASHMLVESGRTKLDKLWREGARKTSPSRAVIFRSSFSSASSPIPSTNVVTPNFSKLVAASSKGVTSKSGVCLPSVITTMTPGMSSLRPPLLVISSLEALTMALSIRVVFP